MLSKLIKDSVDVFTTPETKLDDGQFFIDGYHAPFRFDWNGNSSGILLQVRDNIPSKINIH